MFLSNVLRFIGPVKLIVLSLAVLLPIVEFADGAFDVGDVCAFLVLILLLDDILNTNLFFLLKDNSFGKQYHGPSGLVNLDEVDKISFKGGLPKSHFVFASKEGVLLNHHVNNSDGVPTVGRGKDPLWRSLPMRKGLANKRKMSLFFLVIMMIPMILEYFKMPESVYEVVFAVIMIFWSIALFINSYLEYRKDVGTLKLKLFYCHLAMFVFIVGMIRLSS